MDRVSSTGESMSKLRKSAQGQECQIRIPGVCNGNPETTVLAHLNGGGMGAKRSDIHAAYACSDCHDFVDGRSGHDNREQSNRVIYHLQGVIRTQEIMLKEGLIKI
jgi:hypothetical protein